MENGVASDVNGGDGPGEDQDGGGRSRSGGGRGRHEDAFKSWVRLGMMSDNPVLKRRLLVKSTERLFWRRAG